MMGRQFQIYLLPSDAVRLIEMLRQKVGLCLLAPNSENSSPTEIESPVAIQGGFERADCFLMRDASASVYMRPVEKRGYWSVDSLFSEVLEFSGCHFDGKTLKRGRLFYDAGFYEETGAWKDKPPDFLKWAEAIFRATKKVLKRNRDMDAYIGEDAFQWKQAGGAFIKLAIQGRPPILEP